MSPTINRPSESEYRSKVGKEEHCAEVAELFALLPNFVNEMKLNLQHKCKPENKSVAPPYKESEYQFKHIEIPQRGEDLGTSSSSTTFLLSASVFSSPSPIDSLFAESAGGLSPLSL